MALHKLCLKTIIFTYNHKYFLRYFMECYKMKYCLTSNNPMCIIKNTVSYNLIDFLKESTITLRHNAHIEIFSTQMLHECIILKIFICHI